ncbi:hypothetical protein COO60DRAFT_529522 [Scenedesmus sp. NREL 46B-D3]|nr:hypothetical protein COO60DRAFT_529522 [Scenedesmus sp. NREL 46B-D3]
MLRSCRLLQSVTHTTPHTVSWAFRLHAFCSRSCLHTWYMAGWPTLPCYSAVFSYLRQNYSMCYALQIVHRWTSSRRQRSLITHAAVDGLLLSPCRLCFCCLAAVAAWTHGHRLYVGAVAWGLPAPKACSFVIGGIRQPVLMQYCMWCGAWRFCSCDVYVIMSWQNRQTGTCLHVCSCSFCCTTRLGMAFGWQIACAVHVYTVMSWQNRQNRQ